MGVREKINSSRTMGFVVAGVLLAVAAGQIAFFFRPQHHQSATGAFYTDDDGQTYFADNVYKFPPWDHDGKQANMAMVYSSASGNFVAIRFATAGGAEGIARPLRQGSKWRTPAG